MGFLTGNKEAIKKEISWFMEHINKDRERIADLKERHVKELAKLKDSLALQIRTKSGAADSVRNEIKNCNYNYKNTIDHYKSEIEQYKNGIKSRKEDLKNCK